MTTKHLLVFAVAALIISVSILLLAFVGCDITKEVHQPGQTVPLQKTPCEEKR
jgi:hypothetical protein